MTILSGTLPGWNRAREIHIGAASCVATGDVRLWALDRVSFNVILMKTTISKRENMKELLLKTQVFSQLTEYELLTIADTLQEETFEDGTVICNEGDNGDKFYLVKEGTAVCTIEQNEVARLTSGSYFGEVSSSSALDEISMMHKTCSYWNKLYYNMYIPPPHR